MEDTPINILITLNGNFCLELMSFNKKAEPKNPAFLK
jgi:hypothetical protein